ncbi:MAG: hypothetical protein K0S65_4902 [Labilithrix sp.]|nr:hypothetical protein [Labilithrix sp.]
MTRATRSMSVPTDLLGMRYRASSKSGHVESWFLKTNEPDGRRALWVRCTIFARPPLPPMAEAWAIAFDRHRGHVAVKSTVGLEVARFARDDVDVEVDGCALSLDHARGVLASGRGALAWDLAIGPSLAAPIVHFASRAMYKDGLPPSSKLVTPLSDARTVGELRVDRGGGDVDLWEIAHWPTMVGHNWGRGNAELYAWTHCNVWDTPGLVFEAMSARVRVGPVLSPMATSAFVRWRGQSWDLSTVRALTKNRGSISLRRWEMTGEGGGLTVACDVAAENDDIVGLHYPNPTGPITNCLNTKLARARLELRLPDGETLTTTSRAAALEIGTIQSDHGIRMVL